MFFGFAWQDIAISIAIEHALAVLVVVIDIRNHARVFQRCIFVVFGFVGNDRQSLSGNF